jgi:hypothetical protein
VSQRAADRGTVPDRGIGDQPGRLAEQPAVLGDQRIARQVVERRAGADQQRVALVTDAPQLVKPAHVDQQFRVGQPQPQQRQQALAAGDHLSLIARVAEHVDGFVQ